MHWKSAKKQLMSKERIWKGFRVFRVAVKSGELLLNMSGTLEATYKETKSFAL